MTPAQLAILAKPGPLAWMVVDGNGFVSTFNDQGKALNYAARDPERVLVPMVPEARMSVRSTKSGTPP